MPDTTNKQNLDHAIEIEKLQITIAYLETRLEQLQNALDFGAKDKERIQKENSIMWNALKKLENKLCYEVFGDEYTATQEITWHNGKEILHPWEIAKQALEKVNQNVNLNKSDH